MSGSLRKDVGYDDDSTGDEYDAGTNRIYCYFNDFTALNNAIDDRWGQRVPMPASSKTTSLSC